MYVGGYIGGVGGIDDYVIVVDCIWKIDGCYIVGVCVVYVYLVM